MVKKFRKHSRTGVTFISAIAIALGGTAVVSTPATAQDASGESTENVTLVSGIGKNSKYNGTVGPVSEAQNNLPAGSCSFSHLAGNGNNGIANTAGLRFWTTTLLPIAPTSELSASTYTSITRKDAPSQNGTLPTA